MIKGTLDDLRKHYTGCSAKTKKRGKAVSTSSEPVSDGRPVLLALSVFIPGELTSSLNTMLHQHTGEAFCDKTRWRDAVGPVFTALAEATGRRRVEIFRSAKRELDPDNLYASVKFLLDAIKDNGGLVDDKRKWVDLAVDQGWLPELGKGTRITVTPIKDLADAEPAQE